MSVAGDTQEVAGRPGPRAAGDRPRDLEHGSGELALLSVQSPPVAVSELYGRQMAEVAGYDDDEDY